MIEEVVLRNNTFIAAVHLLKSAKGMCEILPEYPEFNAMIIEIDAAIENTRDRLLSIAATSDRGMMTRVHQIDSIGGL